MSLALIDIALWDIVAQYRIAAVRKLIGPNRHLLVDANQKWTACERLYDTYPRTRAMVCDLTRRN